MINVNIPTTLVNELLSNLGVVGEVDKFSITITNGSQELSAAKTSTLGQKDETVNGLKSLTVNDNESIPGVIEITPDVPGYSSSLTNTITTGSALELITGNTVGNGSLNVIVLSNGIRSIKAVLTIKTSVTPSYSVVSDIVPTSLQDVGQSSYNNINANDGNTNTIVTSIGSEVTTFSNNLDAAIGTRSSGVLDNISLDIINYVEQEVRKVTTADIPQSIVDDVTFDITVRKNYTEAIEKLKPFSKVSVKDLEQAVVNIPTSPSTQITPFSPSTDIFGQSTKKIKDVHPSAPELWRGSKTDLNIYEFTEVSSMEELIAEFRSMTRDVTEFVTHWTANFNNQGWIGAKEVHELMINRTDTNFNGIGYHYIIKRNGVIERGRPINVVGAHALGHNKYSIGIAFVAGYNCNSGTTNPNRHLSPESITQSQFNAFDRWVQAFYSVWPGGQAFGHNDTDPTRKSDPGFDVSEYVRVKFGKENVIAANQGPLSPAQLVLVS